MLEVFNVLGGCVLYWFRLVSNQFFPNIFVVIVKFNFLRFQISDLLHSFSKVWFLLWSLFWGCGMWICCKIKLIISAELSRLMKIFRLLQMTLLLLHKLHLKLSFVFCFQNINFQILQIHIFRIWIFTLGLKFFNGGNKICMTLIILFLNWLFRFKIEITCIIFVVYCDRCWYFLGFWHPKFI